MNKIALDDIYGTGVAEYALTVTCYVPEDCGYFKDHVPHMVCIDAKDYGNWARHINDGPHSGLRSNVAFDDDGTIVVTDDIHVGQELLADYGLEYW